MELNDFTESNLKLEDLKADEVVGDIPISPKAAGPIAAGEVLISPNPNRDDYRFIKESLLSSSGREGYILRHEARIRNIVGDFENEIQEILLDPTVPDTQKQDYINNFRSSADGFRPSANTVLMEQALMSPAEDETETDAVVRLNMADMIEEVNQVKRTATIARNELAAELNPDIKSMAVDLGELIIPFVETTKIKRMQKDLDAKGGGILLGSSKQALIDSFKDIPYNKRAEINEKLLEYIKENSNILLPDGNDLIALDTLSKITSAEDYTDNERWFDNTISVLEFTGLLGILKILPKASKSKRMSSVASEVVPTSPSQLVRDVHPNSARNMHTEVAEDVSGEAAEGLYGASRDEALGHDILPQAVSGNAPAENRLVMDEPKGLTKLRHSDGQTYLSVDEVAQAEARVVSDFTELEGMRPRRESTSIRTKDDGSIGIDIIYGGRDSGFINPREALNRAKYALRNYGVDDHHLTLFRRDGDKIVETSLPEVEGNRHLLDAFNRAGIAPPGSIREADYFVGLRYDYKLKPEDIQGYDVLATNQILGFFPTNILDRLPVTPGSPSVLGEGSLTQNLLDSASVLHPQIVEPALVKIDKSVALKKAYVEVFEGFTNGYKKLKKDRRLFMSDYIHEANQEGIPFNEVDLMARGFDRKEVGLLRDWRRGNDIMFHAMNEDMVQGLRARNYKMYSGGATDTRLIAKPMKRGSVSGNTEYYDVVSGELKAAKDPKELDDLYEGGGTYAHLSEPINLGDDVWVDVIRTEGGADNAFLRDLNPQDMVLKYRDGYYPKVYDANFFVQQTIKKADGTEFVKTLGTAKSRADADEMLKMLRIDNPDNVYDHIPNKSDDLSRNLETSMGAWNSQVSSGLSAQRVRGEQLVDASSTLNHTGSTNLIDPLEAVSQQISQLSNRIAIRPYMDSMKQRWLDNYGEMLNMPKDRSGRPMFPGSVKDIKRVGGVAAQDVADARSMFNYLYGLENGYINRIDIGFKAGIEALADQLSAVGWGKADAALRDWGKGSITGTTKGAAFKMYLAANPARQLLIQSHQAAQLAAINPKYLAGPMQKDMYRLRRVMMGYEGDAEATKMFTELKDSGMLDAVDANNLVRQDTLTLADLTVPQKVKSAANYPLKKTQEFGFDKAEQFVLVTSWLTHRDMAVKAGRKLTRREYDDIAGKARAYTYAMNRGGDMPYNENSLNLVAQFLQVPHKAFLQPITNKSLTPRQRAQLLTWNTIMYGGVPAGVTHSLLGGSMEDGPVKDALAHGLEHVLLNATASLLTGEKQQVDWGDFTPHDLHGMSDLMTSIWTGSGVKEVLFNTPALSTVGGQNPRITNMLKTAARWVNVHDDYDDPELNTKFTDVAKAFMSLSSGYSNTFKANYAFDTGTKLSSLGNVTDNDVTEFEAAMQFFGFRTMTEEGTRKIREELNEGKKFTSNDVNLWYSDLKRQLTKRGVTVAEGDMAMRVISEGMRVFQHEPEKFQESLFRLIKNDVEKHQYNIFEDVMGQIGWQSNADVLKLLDNMPASELKSKVKRSIINLGE